MIRLTNPVFQEGVHVYLDEGHGLGTYASYAFILIGVQFLTFLVPSLDPQGWIGSAYLLRFTSGAALVFLVYFSLRFANQEYVPWRFQPLHHWWEEEKLTIGALAWGQMVLFLCNVMILVFFSLPPLIWAAAIARTDIRILSVTLILLVFYAVTYGIWGLVAAATWEHRLESRKVFVRCLFAYLVFVSALVYMPLNPVAYLLSYLEGEELVPSLWHLGEPWSSTTLHFGFHLSLFIFGAYFYWRALKKRNLT